VSELLDLNLLEYQLQTQGLVKAVAGIEPDPRLSEIERRFIRLPESCDLEDLVTVTSKHELPELRTLIQSGRFPSDFDPVTLIVPASISVEAAQQLLRLHKAAAREIFSIRLFLVDASNGSAGYRLLAKQAYSFPEISKKVGIRPVQLIAWSMAIGLPAAIVFQTNLSATLIDEQTELLSVRESQAASPVTSISEQLVAEETVVELHKPAIKPQQSEAEPEPERLARLLEQWRLSWQQQQADSYLAHYQQGFSSRKSLSSEEWQQWRRGRLKAPEWIRIDLADIDIEVNGNGEARATFVQLYRSPGYSDTVRKTLFFTSIEGEWLISDERVSDH